MKNKKRIFIEALSMVFILAITLILMQSYYRAGREKGREETVQMINEMADEYIFYIKDNTGYWQLGSGGGTTAFDDWNSFINHSYDADDGKIRLSYSKE